MAKIVEYKNTCGQAQYINVGKIKSKDLITPTPEVFDNDFDGYPILALSDVICTLFPGGDVTKKPMFYIRHTDMIKNEFRFGNVLEFGDDFLSPQKGVYHIEEVAQAGGKLTPYAKMSPDKEIYGYGSDVPFSEFRFTDEYMSAKEGEFLSVKGEYWPRTIYEHESMYNHVSTFIQAATFTGVFEGKKVMGLGEHDRLFIPTVVNGFDGITANFGYVYANMMGIREDGRKEQCLISLENSGKILGYYTIDGETPIVCDHVTMEADWYRLPYVDDGTCIFENAVFRFCGKEFHFEGKWGTKGFTPEPRVEKHGQSQVFGTWYEGSVPYQHRVYMAFNENMEAYDYKLEALGFNVFNKK